MPDSREGSRATRSLRRRLLALALAPTAVALLSAETPAPAATSSPGMAVLTVTKADANTKAPLKGAVFLVCLNGDKNCPDTTAAPHLTTDDTGTAQKTLATPPPGSQYCLREITPPSGYQPTPASYAPGQCFAFAGDTLVAVTDLPAPTPTPTATPTPTPTPSPTPSPTPPPPGELQITKVDPGNKTITTPGFTFNIHVGSATGLVIATISTDGTGTAVAGALNPAMYCVEEISAPDGYQVAPTYSPAQCVQVASDNTQGKAPTLVSVIDPPAATPTPSAAAIVPSATPSPTPSPAAVAPQPPSSPAGAVARGLVGLGALLLLAGAVMILVAIRRRRHPPAGTPPSDYWYDSTIT
jgi:uncharacterized surface anchored protein